LVESYFRLQRYHLDQRALLGLREFLHRAREAGAVAVTPEIELAAVAVAP
jgi:predicted solute-binding protein